MEPEPTVAPMVDPASPRVQVNRVTFYMGDPVQKVGGDYSFEGIIVAKFAKLSGAVRYVVEDDRGVLHVYSYKNLALR